MLHKRIASPLFLESL